MQLICPHTSVINENTMSDIRDTKPEPIAAKPNWNYDSYFLAQLERINQQSASKQPKKRVVEQAPKDDADAVDEQNK